MDPKAIFHEAITTVFDRWTTLALAVEQGWGGRDSRQKRILLEDEVIQYLEKAAKKKRPPSHENEGDVDDLAYFLYLRVDELFNTETDDGSPNEVACFCIRLYNTCKAGDTAFAQQILQACSAAPQGDLAKSQGFEHVEYATEEDMLLDKMEGMEVDDSGDDASDGAAEGNSQMEPPLAAGNTDAPSVAFGPGLTGAPATAGYAEESAPAKPRAPPPEPEVDEDGFTSVVKGRRRPK